MQLETKGREIKGCNYLSSFRTSWGPLQSETWGSLRRKKEERKGVMGRKGWSRIAVVDTIETHLSIQGEDWVRGSKTTLPVTNPWT